MVKLESIVLSLVVLMMALTADIGADKPGKQRVKLNLNF